MAKQFLANRSGQTPTLDEVPNETIKIYPTEADLDADLANLEENEIVATDEDNNPASGTQYPVDVVQNGNMNAVTSNAVANAFKGMSIAECGKIPGYDNSWYIKYDSGILEQWFTEDWSVTVSANGNAYKVVNFPIAFVDNRLPLEITYRIKGVYGQSLNSWVGSTNGASSDSNDHFTAAIYSFAAYNSVSTTLQIHAVGFWK